jgi:hypothetical protein
MTGHHPGLQELVGRELSSVEFVRGYAQFRFDGPCLSAYTMPTIRTTSGTVLDSSTVGYADALVASIGKIVQAAEQGDTAIEIRFVNGPTVALSLKRSERRADEAATLTTDGATIWTW